MTVTLQAWNIWGSLTDRCGPGEGLQGQHMAQGLPLTA